MNYYAALDLGTSGKRTIIFDKKCRGISCHYKEWGGFFLMTTIRNTQTQKGSMKQWKLEVYYK
ncbi:MAG: hypothetical protein ACTSWY_11285 [Promethearchaeota archaeon]